MNRINILLAEDDKGDFLFFVEAFEKISPDYKITRAKNGMECITFLKTREKPHLIFLDLNIPIKNGLECLKYIKENDLISDIPVVIYSTSHYIKQIDAAYKQGACNYIVKPNNSDVLVEILNEVLLRMKVGLPVPGKDNFVVRKPAGVEL